MTNSGDIHSDVVSILLHKSDFLGLIVRLLSVSRNT